MLNWGVSKSLARSGFAGVTLFGLKVRMLEFEHPTLIGLHICYVLLAVFGTVDDLLPIVREVPFPSAVPLGFVFPPWITGSFPFVSPMPYPFFFWAAFGNHFRYATRA